MSDKNHNLDPEKLKKEIKEELLKREILMSLEEDEIDLFELFGVLFKHWKLIIVFPLLVAVATAFYSLTLPDEFKADATIYVHSSRRGISSLLSDLPLGGLGLSSGSSSSADYLLSYLNSRSMSEKIISRFSIATHPVIVGNEPPNEIVYDRVLRTLKDIVTIEQDREGLISIAVETKSAQLSREMVSAYIEYLQKFARSPKQEIRLFIERQLEKNRAELSQAEYLVREFQDKHRIFSVEHQVSAMIDKLSNLEANLMTTEINIKMQDSMLKSSGNLPELIRLEAEKVSNEAKVAALKKEIETIEKQIEQVPDRILDYTRLQRDLAVKEKVFTVITEQYETAKISEAEEGSMFEVIDYPRVPELKSKPARARMVVLAGISAGVFAVFAAFLIEFIRRRKESEKAKAKATAKA